MATVVKSVTSWLGIASAVVTLGLAGLNAYWSRQISDKASALEEKKLELDRQNVSITEGKERMARYAFVQNLFGQVLNETDPGQRTLAVNLINLTLTEAEANKLFTGLQTSQDKRAQEVGNIGTDLLAITNLIQQVDAAAKESRTGAVQTLINNYRGDSRAVDQALTMLESPRVEKLSASGRINVLVFLRNTDAAAWTPALLARVDGIIKGALARHEAREIVLGAQTLDAISQLSTHLKGIARP